MLISDWSSDVCSSDLLLHRAELVERVQCFAMRILRKRVLLGRDRIVLAHDAGDRLGLGHLALFDELLEGAETAATGGHPEEPGLVAPLRSGKRRVGKQCVSTCRYRVARDL